MSQKITSSSSNLNLALESFINENLTLKLIDKEIERITRLSICDNCNCKTPIQLISDRLNFVNVHSIDDLEELLLKNKDLIISFANEYLSNERPIQLSHGISIFYLCYVLIGETKDKALADYYSDRYIFELSEQSIQRIKKNGFKTEHGDRILNTYKYIAERIYA